MAVLVGLRLFLMKPGERRPDYRAAFGADAHKALEDLLADPRLSAARAAEARADWEEARAAYARLLEDLRLEEPGDAAVAVKRRALASKLEEIERRLRR